jgi:Glycosyl hydrolases family 18
MGFTLGRAVVVGFISLLAAALEPVKASGTERPLVVAYVPNWIALRPFAATLDYARVTHLNIAFENPLNDSGELSFNAEDEALIAAAHDHGVKVLVSIGGGSASGNKAMKARYAHLLSSPHRAGFAATLAAYVADHHLDGLDVDIEGPSITPDYGPFIDAVAQAFQGKGWLLTAALSRGYGGENVPVATVAHFDWINIMAYDATGSWDPQSPGQHSSFAFAQECVAWWLQRGLPPERAVLGLPFYGAAFGREARGHGWTYAEILAAHPGAEKADQIGDTIWYNGPATIQAKCRWALGQTLRGLMIWSLDGDAAGEDSLLRVMDATLRPASPAPTTTPGASTPDQKLTPSAKTLTGSVMCGYQGWFGTPAEGASRGWRHYGFDRPNQCHIDLWPDVSELDPAEKHLTPLRFADGTPAAVFDSKDEKTVRRHFRWMREYGIDGVYLQRFGSDVRDAGSRRHGDTVLRAVRTAAEAEGRSWVVMYDLSGLRLGDIDRVVMQDWKYLRQELRILESPAYQHHAGKPVVAVWGIGFSDGRAYTLEECGQLLRFLHDNPEFGRCTVMAGVPWGWRTLDQDALKDPALHQVLASADIISPWAVGRYHNPENAARMIGRVHPGDRQWCQEHGKTYLPVVFPGFSWGNLTRARGRSAVVDQIPRLGGRFLWHQAHARLSGGAEMLYVAMFDEMDEGTAIFKTSSTVPQLPWLESGASAFVTEPALPSDHYLWLTGQIRLALQTQTPMSRDLPERK